MFNSAAIWTFGAMMMMKKYKSSGMFLTIRNCSKTERSDEMYEILVRDQKAICPICSGLLISRIIPME